MQTITIDDTFIGNLSLNNVFETDNQYKNLLMTTGCEGFVYFSKIDDVYQHEKESMKFPNTIVIPSGYSYFGNRFDGAKTIVVSGDRATSFYNCISDSLVSLYSETDMELSSCKFDKLEIIDMNSTFGRKPKLSIMGGNSLESLREILIEETKMVNIRGTKLLSLRKISDGLISNHDNQSQFIDCTPNISEIKIDLMSWMFNHRELIEPHFNGDFMFGINPPSNFVLNVDTVPPLYRTELRGVKKVTLLFRITGKHVFNFVFPDMEELEIKMTTDSPIMITGEMFETIEHLKLLSVDYINEQSYILFKRGFEKNVDRLEIRRH